MKRPRKPTIYDRPGIKGLPDVVETESETESEEAISKRDRLQSIPPQEHQVEVMDVENERDAEMKPSESGSGSDVSYSTDDEPHVSPRAAATRARIRIAETFAMGES